MPCCVSNTNFQTFLSLDPIPGSWLAISTACSSCHWPAPNLPWAQLAPLAMMHTTHLQISTTKHIWKMELCQFPTNTAAFSTRVDIIFKGLEIWMFAEFYYFPLALIANYGPGMILFWLWPWRIPSGRILFCTCTQFYAVRKHIAISLGLQIFSLWQGDSMFTLRVNKCIDHAILLLVLLYFMKSEKISIHFDIRSGEEQWMIVQNWIIDTMINQDIHTRNCFHIETQITDLDSTNVCMDGVYIFSCLRGKLDELLENWEYAWSYLYHN